MFEISHIITLADEYARAAQIGEKTVSGRVFNDRNKLGALRDGAEITVGRFNAALVWFSENWPEDAVWPADVMRPVVVEAAQ